MTCQCPYSTCSPSHKVLAQDLRNGHLGCTCPPAQDAPDVASCLLRRVRTPVNLWKDATQKRRGVLKTTCQALGSACAPRMALIFQRLEAQLALGYRQKQDAWSLGDHKRFDLYARLSYYSPDTTATILTHGVSPFMRWRHPQTQSSRRRPRQAPFFVPQAGAR